MKTLIPLLLTVSILPLRAFAADIQIEGVSEFNVRSGSWTLVGGELVGTANAGEDALLLSDTGLADFELTLEYKATGSGAVLLRAHELPLTPIPEEVAANELDNGCYAYAAELPDQDGGMVRTTPLGESLSGTFNPVAASSFRPGEWNTLQLRVQEDTLLVFLNDNAAIIVKNTSFTTGMLGFQVKKTSNENQVRFRNIELTDNSRAGKWRPLFNGKNLDGWVEWGTEKWTVEDGIIEGTSGPDKSEGYLATKELWSDFHVRGTFKILGDGNYGLFYHSTIAYNDKNYPIISGIQTEVAPGTPSPSGWLYESYKRGWLEAPDNSRPAAYALNEGEWNEIEVLAQGNRVITWVNGINVADFTDPTPNYDNGAFALQLHAGGAEGILWKDLFVKE